MAGVENGGDAGVDRPAPTAPTRRVGPTTDRVARAGAIGLVLVGVWFVAVLVLVGTVPCDREGLGCLGQAIMLAGLAGLGVFAAGWPALWLARVRPAWPVALLGPVVFVVFVLARELVPLAANIGGLVVAVPAAYAVAAFVTAPGAPPRARLAVGVILAALVPLAILVLR